MANGKNRRRIKTPLRFSPHCFFFVLNTQMTILSNQEGPEGGGRGCNSWMINTRSFKKHQQFVKSNISHEIGSKIKSNKRKKNSHKNVNSRLTVSLHITLERRLLGLRFLGLTI